MIRAFLISMIFLICHLYTWGDALETDFDSYQKYRQFLLERHSAYCQLKLNQAVDQLKVQYRYGSLRKNQQSDWNPNNSGVNDRIQGMPVENLITELIALNYLPEYFYYIFDLDPMIWQIDKLESKNFGSIDYNNYHFRRTVPRKLLKKALTDPHPIIRLQNLRYLTSLSGRRISTRVIMLALLQERDPQLIPVYVNFMKSRNFFQTPPVEAPNDFRKRLKSLWDSAQTATGRTSALYLLTSFSEFKAKFPGQTFLESLDRSFPQKYLIELVHRHPVLLQIKPVRLETSDRLAGYLEIAAHFKDQPVVKQRLQHALKNHKRAPFAQIQKSILKAMATWTGKAGLSMTEYAKELEITL